MKIVGVDPGNVRSAYAIWADGKLIEFSNALPNQELLNEIYSWRDQVRRAPFSSTWLVVESIEGFGMTAGMTLFETVWWSGRFYEAWESSGVLVRDRISRKAIKRALCGVTNAKDKDVREYLCQRFGAGDESRAWGTKKAPGPLYGLAGDGLAALAVALAYEMRLMEGTRLEAVR